MTKKDSKSKLKLEIKESEEESNCNSDEAIKNLAQFVEMLIEIDYDSKKRKIEEGGTKCKNCKVKINNFEDFCNISTDPMCPKCYADYLENHPQKHLFE